MQQVLSFGPIICVLLGKIKRIEENISIELIRW